MCDTLNDPFFKMTIQERLSVKKQEPEETTTSIQYSSNADDEIATLFSSRF